MNADISQKVTASHLKRDAYLYVRQSTVRQVFENTESTQRQYGLRQRAIALGWPPDRVIVIDTDLGQSGATAADRTGFQQPMPVGRVAREARDLQPEHDAGAAHPDIGHESLEICALKARFCNDHGEWLYWQPRTESVVHA